MQILGIIMLNTGAFKDAMQKVLKDPEALKFEYYMHAVFLVLVLIMFISSIGLLKRKNWSRILFIIILALGIILSLGEIFFWNIFGRGFMPAPAGKDALYMHGFQVIMRIIATIFGIGFTILFAWIIRMLVSKDIRQEFTGQ